MEIKYLSFLKNLIFSMENLWPFFKVNFIVGELFAVFSPIKFYLGINILYKQAKVPFNIFEISSMKISLFVQKPSAHAK